MLTPTPTQDDENSPIFEMIGKGYDLSSYGLSETCVNLARQWIDECSSSQGKHEKCPKIVPAELPTRVIDVEEMRLRQSTPGELGDYAALSHCWGGSNPISTTKENLASYTQQLPSVLPQTFADAIAVTKALRIRFLWIDSLCIVQDSKDDWTSESAHMAKVYENANITISADAAKGSFEGFLSLPSRSVRASETIQYYHSTATGAGEYCTIHVRQRGKLGLMLPYHDWMEESDIRSTTEDPRWLPLASRDDEPEYREQPYSRLSTRGWVFQERLLAPRTLHFAGSEMAWECRSICNCECSVTSFRRVRKTSLLKYWLGNTTLDEAHTYWRSELVREYSRLELTHYSDRVVAFAGLAEAVSRLRPGDQYLVGLWKNTLRWDLLWCLEPTKESSRLASTIAPTWSWASITGAVVYPLTRKTTGLRWTSEKFQIDEIHLIPSLINPFGVFQDRAYIYVRGMGTSVHIGKDIGPNESSVLLETKQLAENKLVVTFDIYEHGLLGKSEQATAGSRHGESYTFLVACCSEAGPCGLLLKKLNSVGRDASSEDTTLRTYERVGYVQPQIVRHEQYKRRGSSVDVKQSMDHTLEKMMAELSALEDPEDRIHREREHTWRPFFKEMRIRIA